MRLRKLLIVHPSRSVRTVLEKIILSDGGDIAVVHAESGTDAIGIVETDWIDLVLTDIGLTDLAPDEISNTYAGYSKNKQMAVIAIAGGDSPDEVNAMNANGFEHFVVPPFEPGLLNRKINTLCNPRQWRKAARYHFPDAKVIISVWGMEADARLINLSQGGVLVEAAGDRSELFLQNNPKLTIMIKMADGYFNIDGIPAKLERLNTIEWNPDYKPSVMRMVYIFLEMDALVQGRLEQVLNMAEEDQLHTDAE